MINLERWVYRLALVAFNTEEGSMTLAKPAKTETPLPASGPTRKASGRNVHWSERHTVMLQIRVEPALADKARAMAAARGMTLGQILQAGVETLAELGE